MKANESGSEHSICRDFLTGNSLIDSLRESIQSKVKTTKKKPEKREESLQRKTQKEMIMDYYKSMKILI